MWRLARALSLSEVEGQTIEGQTVEGELGSVGVQWNEVKRMDG